MSTQPIALTFDDGPADWTEPILNTLAEHSARATFFVIGSAAEQRPELIRRIDADGHEVGNHTWSHPRLSACDDDLVRDQLERTNALLIELLGRAPRRFRAPHYDADGRVLAIASELGLAHTGGNVTPPDWHASCTAAYITAFVVKQARAGTIVGLHDGIPPGGGKGGRTRQATVDSVGMIIPRLRDLGFECVTAGMLLETAA
jgi:chitooligosaccharide deacetylase